MFYSYRLQYVCMYVNYVIIFIEPEAWRNVLPPPYNDELFFLSVLL